MKKILFSLSMVTTVSFVVAQDVDRQNWFHNNVEESGIYGVGTNAAIQFLTTKNLKPTTIVVGVLDSGVEVDHPDLAKNMWVNPKEKAGNGKDDDKNGFIDDIYGWDFVADKTGEDYNKDSYEATRVVVQYGKWFNTGDKSKDEANIQKMPTQYQVYLRARRDWAKKYFSAKEGVDRVLEDQQGIINFLKQLEAYAGSLKLTQESIEELPEATESDKESKEKIAFIITQNPEFQGKSMGEIIAEAQKEFDKEKDNFGDDLKYAYNPDYNPVQGIDFTKSYGNNEVEGPDARHGTHVAGIIAAVPNNNLGMDGVAGTVAKIMSVRVVPDGDERDENVANGIRYAVDNGAKILNMSFGKGYSPNIELVWEAMKYASDKGVLMFHAAGNDNKDLDFNTNYPTNFKDDEMTSFVKNWVTIGASTRNNDALKASFSNYGTARVDIFSPGTEIYSTVPDGEYEYLQGTSMASPVAAGCAALLWAYFPKLTASEVRDILMESANQTDLEQTVGSEGDKRNFDRLSKTGGIIDVYKAVQLAYKKYGTSKSNTK